MSKLPYEWALCPLSDLATVTSGGTPSRFVKEFWDGGTLPWVTPTDITATSGRFLSQSKEMITPLGLASCSAKLLPAGAILMTSRATLGESRIATREVCTNQGFKSLVPLRNTDVYFLLYQMQLNKPSYERLGIGSTFLEVSKKATESFLLKTPPLPQQRRIAEILSTVDEAIEATEALIAKQQQIKAGLMHDLFTRGVWTADSIAAAQAAGSPAAASANVGQLRPPQSTAPELYKDSPLGWIPKDWEVTPIGRVFHIQLGKMLSKASKTGRGSAPYLGNRSVQWDRIDLTSIEEMDFNASERVKFELLPGDLLVCEGGEVGRTAMWRGEMTGCFYQKALHRLRPLSDVGNPSFMLRYMRYAYLRGVFHLFTSQSSIAHLTHEKLSRVPMLVPGNDEQRSIAEFFDVFEEQADQEGQKLEKLQKQKQGLMQDLLSGEVKVMK
jgi:type I restriction enzyme S subunit